MGVIAPVVACLLMAGNASAEDLSPLNDPESPEKLFESIEYLAASRATSNATNTATDDVVIRGQSPGLLSALANTSLRLAGVVAPTELLDQTGDLLESSARLASGAITNRAGRFRADYAYDSSGFERIGGNLMLSSALPVALDSDFFYREFEPPTGGVGHVWNGDVNLIYKLQVHPRWKFRTGAGVNWLHVPDSGDVRTGANFTYGLDFTLHGGWLVSGVIDWGRLDGDALFRWRVTTGVVWGNTELFIGYDDYKAGDDKFNGILAGAGFWF